MSVSVCVIVSEGGRKAGREAGCVCVLVFTSEYASLFTYHPSHLPPPTQSLTPSNPLNLTLPSVLLVTSCPGCPPIWVLGTEACSRETSSTDCG